MNHTTEHESDFEVGVAPPMGTMQGDENRSGTAGVKERVTRSAKEAGAAVKQTTATAAAKAKEMGQDAAYQLKDQSMHFADTRKTELAQKLKGGGEAVRRAAEKLREENDPNIAGYAAALADRIERAGDYLQTRDFNSMRRDLEQVARRRPEVVFGAMFVAGLALARFLKASSREGEHESRYQSEDYLSYEGEWEEHTETPQVSMADVPPQGTSMTSGTMPQTNPMGGTI